MTDRAGDVDLPVRVQLALTAFLQAQRRRLGQVDPGLLPVADAAATLLLDGGKRLRPAFCYWGWRGAGGRDGPGVVAAAASLELLHASALVHDDLMDGSDTRRGQPAAHRRFAALHQEAGWRGDPAAFGSSAAVLLGDLCLIWADQLLNTCGLEPAALQRAQPVYDEMRVELMAGQYLDLLEQVAGGESVSSAMRVARYKSAKYTVERPLHLGGTLAGATAELLQAYSQFGLPLGEAFQLRDDVLGVFGDPAQTGKPAGDDLREGKRTVLVAMTLEAASPAQADQVQRYLGDPELTPQGLADLRTVICETGALSRVESLIEALTSQCLQALADAPVADAARRPLADLATAATSRTG